MTKCIKDKCWLWDRCRVTFDLHKTSSPKCDCDFLDKDFDKHHEERKEKSLFDD